MCNPRIGVGSFGLSVVEGSTARRLGEAGFNLAVYDLEAAACERQADCPIYRVAASPADAARDARFVITVLPDADCVRDASISLAGAAPAMANGELVQEMTTGDALICEFLGRHLRGMGLRAIDAPVGRSPDDDAARGSLRVFASGATEDIDEARSVLKVPGNETIHAGPLGSGIQSNPVNKYMSMAGMVTTAEALLFSRQLELDRNAMVCCLQDTTAGNGQINVRFPGRVLAGEVAPGFPLRHGVKDNSLALELGKPVGVPLGLGAVSSQGFSLVRARGRSEEDGTPVLRLLADIAGENRGRAA